MSHEDPTEEISSDSLLLPCVYGWNRQGTYLYIGVSKRGIRRPLGLHHIIGRKDQLLEGDRIHIWRFPTFEEAVIFEQKLINEHKPIFNIQLYEQKSRYQPNEKREIKCGNCGVTIVTGRTKGQTAQKYCNDECRWRAWDKANPRVKASIKQ